MFSYCARTVLMLLCIIAQSSALSLITRNPSRRLPKAQSIAPLVLAAPARIGSVSAPVPRVRSAVARRPGRLLSNIHSAAPRVLIPFDFSNGLWFIFAFCSSSFHCSRLALTFLFLTVFNNHFLRNIRIWSLQYIAVSSLNLFAVNYLLLLHASSSIMHCAIQINTLFQ